MSDYEQLQKTVSVLTAFEIIFLTLGVVMLIVAVVLFVKYKIPNVYSEITGAKKQKQLSQMVAEKQLDINNVYEVTPKKAESIQGTPPPQNRNGTVSKENQSNVKDGADKKIVRHKTSLASIDRQTMVMDKSSRHKTHKQHQTVVMDKEQAVKQKYTVLEETVIINSKEIIN